MAVTVNLIQPSRNSKSGKLPIYIRLYQDKKLLHINTGIYVAPKYWNDNKQNVRSTHGRHVTYNDELSRLRNKAENRVLELKRRGNLDIELVQDYLEGKGRKNLIKCAESYHNYLKENEKYWPSRHFKVVIGNLESFIENKSMPDQLDKLDSAWIENFQDYLLRDIGNSNNTVRKKLQRFKGMTDWLFKNKEISQDPFSRVERVESEKTNSKVKLSIEQIRDIENLDLEEGTDLWHTRNYFLYSFYDAGIRFGDLCCLKWNNLIDGRLVYSMNKTGQKKSIKQLSPMKEILDYYRKNDQKASDYIFPLLDKPYDDPLELRKKISSKNVQVNQQLKDLAEMANIEANISFHVSRHSFSHYALKKGMDLYSISKALGHSSIKITEQYLKEFDEDLLDKGMRNIFGKNGQV